MTTAQLALADAVAASLLEAPALAGGRVKVGRALPLQIDSASAIFVRLVRSAGGDHSMAGDVTRWTSVIAIDCYVRAAAGQDAHAAVDPLLQDAFARVCASALPPGCISLTAQPQVVWDIDEADSTLGAASLVLSVDHFTGPASLAAFT